MSEIGRFEGGVTSNYVNEQIDSFNDGVDTICVHINSVGGNVNEGIAIYNALRRRSGEGKRIITSCEGLAASIASIIFLAGDEREIYDSAQVMIHNPSSFGAGNSDDFERTAESLRVAESRLAEIYEKRSGLTEEQAREQMKEETWMSANTALENGFATKVINTDQDAESAQAMNQQRFKIAARAFSKRAKADKKSISDKPEGAKNNVNMSLFGFYKGKPQAILATLDSGVKVEFSGDSIADGAEAVNTEKGAALADGSYKTEKGETFSVSNGIVSDYKSAAENSNANFEARLAKAEQLISANAQGDKAQADLIAQKDAEISALKAQLSQYDERMSKVEQNLAASTGSHKPNTDKTEKEFDSEKAEFAHYDSFQAKVKELKEKNKK